MHSKQTIASSHFSTDIAEFIESLYRFNVRYLLVGGEAVIFYGHARLTGDVDFFFENTEENAYALLEFWKGSIPEIESASELREPGLILQFGVPPDRIDLMNRISGVNFLDAWANRVEQKTWMTYLICQSQIITKACRVNKAIIQVYMNISANSHRSNHRKKRSKKSNIYFCLQLVH